MPVSFRDVMAQMDWAYLLQLVISVVPAVVCMTVHELSHGLAARMMGDNTAETAKRLSLNPLRHIDPAGLVMLVVFKIGWAKPVPVNAMNFRNPRRGMALTALAGPASNLLLSFLLLFVRGLVTAALYSSVWGKPVLSLLDTTAYLSLCLGVFNLIPIPPMDGAKLLFSFLPDRKYAKLLHWEKYGMIAVVVIMLTGVLNAPLAAADSFLFDKFFIAARAGFALAGVFS